MMAANFLDGRQNILLIESINIPIFWFSLTFRYRYKIESYLPSHLWYLLINSLKDILLFGFITKISAMMPFTYSGIFVGFSSRSLYFPVWIKSYSLSVLSSSNGRQPIAIAWRVTPTAHMSVLVALYFLPLLLSI